MTSTDGETTGGCRDDHPPCPSLCPPRSHNVLVLPTIAAGVDLAAARDIQETLRHTVVETPPSGFAPRTITGIDVHFSRDGRTAFAAAVRLDARTLELQESALAARPVSFPYRTGFLSFREVPVALAALRLSREMPDLVMVDGQGLAHPRRFGLACHLGVLLDVPTIGVAKSRLVGRYAEPGPSPGDWTPLEDKGEIVGAVLRSKAGCRPLFVSIGHRIDLETAVGLVGNTVARHRLPEPTRQADRLSRVHA
jgi:deoxyribonuclease V